LSNNRSREKEALFALFYRLHNLLKLFCVKNEKQKVMNALIPIISRAILLIFSSLLIAALMISFVS